MYVFLNIVYILYVFINDPLKITFALSLKGYRFQIILNNNNINNCWAFIFKLKFKPRRRAGRVVDLKLFIYGLLRPENKHRIGLDFSPSCTIRTAGPKKVENTSTLYHLDCGSQVQTETENRHQKPMHARVQFCSDPVRSHAYFPEWKPALSTVINCALSKTTNYLTIIACLRIVLSISTLCGWRR